MAAKQKLWLIISIQLAAVVAGVGVWVLISQSLNNPQAIYAQTMQKMGMGLERLAGSETISEISGSRYRGYLQVNGFDSQAARGFLQGLNQDDSNNPCLDYLTDADNQLRLEFEARLNNPQASQILGSAQIEAGLILNQSKVGGLEVRIVPEGEQKPIPPIYFFIDQNDCTEHLGGEATEGLLGTWWLIDPSSILDGLLAGDPADQLAGGAVTYAQNEDDVQAKDYDQLAEIALDVLKTYIFTDDLDKMVFQPDESANEDAEFAGQTGLIRYDVNFNSDNAATAWVDFVGQVESSSFYQKLSGGRPGPGLSPEEIEALRQSFNEFGQNNDFEIWIDPQTRLLRNLRITNADPDSNNFGSTADLGLVVDKDQVEITLELRQLAASRQCRPDSQTNARPDDCPYLLTLDPAIDFKTWTCPDGSQLVEIEDQISSFCQQPDGQQKRIYNLSLKDNPQPDQTHRLRLTLGTSSQHLGFDYQLVDGEFELAAGIETTETSDNQPVVAPDNAQDGEGLLFGLLLLPFIYGGLDSDGPVSVDSSSNAQDNTRLSDALQVTHAVNSYVANRSAMPQSWSQIESSVNLEIYQPNNINAADAWSLGSIQGQFIDLKTLGSLDETQSAGGLKLAGTDPDAVDHLLVVIGARCLDDATGQLLAIGGIRQAVVIHKLENYGPNCFDI